MSARRNIVVGLFSLCGMGVLAGCGVPVDNGPTALARAGVPFDLLGPSQPVTATTAPSPSKIGVRIYLIGPSGRLVPVLREVPSGQQTLVSVLGILVEGPTAAEITQLGLQSAIPTQTTVLGASVSSGGTATVDVGGTFGQLVGSAQIEAIAQIVFTATSISGVAVSKVTFQLSDQPVDVPVDSGASFPVVTVAQFPSLAPQPSTQLGSP